MEYVWAFLVGGAICVAGQALIDFTKLTPARILVLFVTLGVALTAVGLYDPLVEFAGAGATVPLTGFGYLMAKGVEEAVAEKGLFGAFSGGLSAAAGGIAAAVFFSLLAALLSVIPLLMLIFGQVRVRYPSVICVACSIISLAALAIFFGRSLLIEIKRRLHF